MVSVAQLVERRIVIPVVAGSNPVVHPTQRLIRTWPFTSGSGQALAGAFQLLQCAKR